MMPSCRWPAGLTNNPTFDFIAHRTDTLLCEVIALYLAACEAAAAEESEGWFTLDLEAAGFRLALGSGQEQEIWQAFQDAGLIKRGNDGGWQIIAWSIDHAMPQPAACGRRTASNKGETPPAQQKLLLPPAAAPAGLPV